MHRSGAQLQVVDRPGRRLRHRGVVTAITSAMFVLVARDRWDWPISACLGVLTLFLVFDVAFLGANLLKFAHGGSVPARRRRHLTDDDRMAGRSRKPERVLRGRSQSWTFNRRLKEEHHPMRLDAVGIRRRRPTPTGCL